MQPRSLLPLLVLALLGAALVFLLKDGGRGAADGLEAASRVDAAGGSQVMPGEPAAAPPAELAGEPVVPVEMPDPAVSEPAPVLEPEPAVATQTAAAPALPAAPATPPDRELDLHGTVTDAEGEAIPGAALVVRQAPFRGFRVTDPAFQSAERVVEASTSDAEGGFRMRLEPGMPYDLEVTAPGHARKLLRNLAAGERVELALSRPASLVGRVRNSDGLPVVAARVLLVGDGMPLHETATDDEGRYAFAALAPGRAVVRVLPAAAAPAPLAFLAIDAEQAHERDFEVADGITLQGQVQSAIDDAPLAGARVEALGDLRRSAVTDADGRFVLPGLAVGTPVRVIAAGHAPAAVRSPAPAEGTAIAEVALALQAGRKLAGTVLDPAGAPLADAWVSAAARGGSDDAQPFRTTRSDAAGRFVFEGMRNDRAYGVWARVPGGASAWLEAPQTPRRPEDEALTIALLPPAVLAGRVLEDASDGAGVAPAGRWIELQRVDALEVLESGVGGPAPDGSRAVRADDLGRFRVADLRPGDYLVALRGADGIPELPVRVTLAPAQVRDDLELAARGAGVLAGRVLDPDRAPVAGAIVWILAEDEDPAQARETRSDADGRFRIEGLRAVPYMLGAQPDPDAGLVPYAPLRSSGVLAGPEPIEVVLPVAVDLKGRVLDDRGLGLEGAVVVARLQGRWGIAHARSDARGQFRLRVPAASILDLEIQPPAGAGGAPSPWRVRNVGAVPAGAADLTVRLLRKL